MKRAIKIGEQNMKLTCISSAIAISSQKGAANVSTSKNNYANK